MKRHILILIGFICLSQNTFAQQKYSPYDYAIANAEVNELYQLNNIRFNERALITNPVAWDKYSQYINKHNFYSSSANKYLTTTYIGLGTMLIGLIPMSFGNDIAFYSGTAIATLGCLTSIIGYCGYTAQIGKIKINKKEFIYYLKTSHNGLGIVTVF